jgi:hypothetical protein
MHLCVGERSIAHVLSFRVIWATVSWPFQIFFLIFLMVLPGYNNMAFVQVVSWAVDFSFAFKGYNHYLKCLRPLRLLSSSPSLVFSLPLYRSIQASHMGRRRSAV